MRFFPQISQILLLLSLTGCQSLLTNAKGAFTVDIIKQLKPGTSNNIQTTQLLGTPHRVIDLSQLPNSKETGELWEYDETGYTRLSIFFEANSFIVTTWTLNIRDGEPEQNLKNAIGKFSGSDWKVSTVKWINPHALPDICFFQDNRQGISISYRRTRQEVESIQKWDPTRAPAEISNIEKPPIFCIGESCSPGVISTELIKTWRSCEVPK